MIIASALQLYGAILYFTIEHHDNYASINFGYILHWLLYFGIFNTTWIIIPTLLILQAVLAISRTFAAVEKRKYEWSRNRKKQRILTSRNYEDMFLYKNSFRDGRSATY